MKPSFWDLFYTLWIVWAFLGPIIGVHWTLTATFRRRMSSKELLAIVGYWGLIFLLWSRIFAMITAEAVP
jgi:hypothetical protein